MKKIIISICLGLILNYTTYANSSLISVGVEVPWGTTVSYEHNIGENGLKGYYSTLSGDIDSTTIDATSIGASYTLYGKKVFKGFYFGPGVAYRSLEMSQVDDFTSLTVKAEANIIDIYLSAGYSLLIQNTISIRLGLNIGYGFGELEYTSGSTGISYDPEGLLGAITTSIGYAF